MDAEQAQKYRDFAKGAWESAVNHKEGDSEAEIIGVGGGGNPTNTLQTEPQGTAANSVDPSDTSLSPNSARFASLKCLKTTLLSERCHSNSTQKTANHNGSTKNRGWQRKNGRGTLRERDSHFFG
jgi:hypothetical protein